MVTKSAKDEDKRGDADGVTSVAIRDRCFFNRGADTDP